MASVNSSSTDAQVQAAYDDNASYEEDRSVAKCRAFITAARILIARWPRRVGTRERDVETSIEDVRKELEAARAWLAANDRGSSADGVTNGAVRLLNFNNFR